MNLVAKKLYNVMRIEVLLGIGLVLWVFSLEAKSQELVEFNNGEVADAARVSAANALLDRAYGKPAVKQEQEIVDLPPVVIQLTAQ